MRFDLLRRLLFRVHMWTGLVLGVLFVALGLSGSVLVYHEEIDRLLSPPPQTSAQGRLLALDRIVDAARIAAPEAKGNVLLALPERAGDPVMVRFLASPGSGGPIRNATLFVDPVTGAVLGRRATAMSPLVQFAHDVHGGLLMGREGRPLVGWLGVGMLVLGLSGLVLWWPKPRQWKRAFTVRHSGSGLRFNRELHGAAGIWGFVVFIVVSFTGIAVAFPETLRAAVGGGAPTFNLRTGPEVVPVRGKTRIGAEESVTVARTTRHGSEVVSVMLPQRTTQAISVAVASSADATLLTMVYVDPYRSRAMAVRDPASLSAADGFMAWQRPLHEGAGLGPLWRLLVFASGFLPLLFVVTGITMWVKKRKNRLSMNDPLPEGVAP